MRRFKVFNSFVLIFIAVFPVISMSQSNNDHKDLVSTGRYAFNPDICPHVRFIDAVDSPHFFMENVASVRMKLFRFKDIFPDPFIRMTDHNMNSSVLTDLEGLKSLDTAQVIRDFTFGFPGEVGHVPLGKLTGGQPGIYGFLADRVEPAALCKKHRPIFFPDSEYMNFNFLVLHLKTFDFVLKTDGHTHLIWTYSPDIRRDPGKTEPLLKKGHGDVYVPSSVRAASDLFSMTEPLKAGDTIVISQKHKGRKPGGNFAFHRIKNWDLPKGGSAVDKERNRLAVFTERGFYLPGDTVYIGGVARGPATAEPVRLDIKGPGGKIIRETLVIPDRWGGFSYAFKTGKTTKKGLYTVTVEIRGRLASQSFKIDYFQANEFEIQFRDFKTEYLPGGKVKPVITGRYLSGNPMAGARVEYRVVSRTLQDAQPLPFGSGYKRYSFNLDRLFREGAVFIDKTGRLNENGELPVTGVNGMEAFNHMVVLEMEAIGTSEEGKEFKATARARYFPGSKIIGIGLPRFTGGYGSIEADLVVLDSNGHPTTAAADVTIYNESSKLTGTLEELTIVNRFENKIFKNGDRLPFGIDYKMYPTDRFLIRIDAMDDTGRKVSSSHRFRLPPMGRKSGGLTVRTTPGGFTTGETGSLFIYSPVDAKTLITFERHRLLSWRSHFLQRGQTTEISFPVEDIYFPGIKVRVLVMYDNHRHEKKELDVKVSSRKPNLTVITNVCGPGNASTRIIGPHSKAVARFRVKDHNGNNVRSSLFVYCVDEGNLSLTGYRAPDLMDQLFYRDKEWQGIGKFPLLFSSYNPRSWLFKNPMLDICIDNCSFYGRVIDDTGAPVAGAQLSRYDEKQNLIDRAITSGGGYYCFAKVQPFRLPMFLKIKKKGFVTYRVVGAYPDINNHGTGIIMKRLKPGEKSREAWVSREFIEYYNKYAFDSGFDFGVEGGVLGSMEGGVVGGVLGATGSGEKYGGRVKPEPAFRMNFDPVLFFKKIDTDDTGLAELEFETSELLSTYRIIAVAYNNSAFGNGEHPVTVSSDIVVKESLPEFAVTGDTFGAGILVSNRTNRAMSVRTLVKPMDSNLRVTGKQGQRLRVKPGRNRTAGFHFKAVSPGDTQIQLSVVSNNHSDGMLKPFPVMTDMVDDSVVMFDVGKRIRRRINIKRDYLNPELRVNLSGSISRLLGKMSKILLQYPYGCMEQRTSRILPFLALDERLMKKMDLNKSPDEIKKAVNDYLGMVDEFMTDKGGMAYYRGGQPDTYLTVYVLWAMQIAKERGFAVKGELEKRMISYLQRQTESEDHRCFLHYVMSSLEGSDPEALQELFLKREQLSLTGKVFLYKAIHRWYGNRQQTKVLFNEFQKLLSFQPGEAKAYFVEKGSRRHSYRGLPFYGRRFLTALLLQAILEVEGRYRPAPAVIKWLLDVPGNSWHTTQTNFWILYALSCYQGKGEAKYVDITVNGKEKRIVFTTGDEFHCYEKVLDKQTTAVDLVIDAPGEVCVTTELVYQSPDPQPVERGVCVTRRLYNRDGQLVTDSQPIKKGEFYQVELLVDSKNEIPYGVVDVPVPAGCEKLREDQASARKLVPFKSAHAAAYGTSWLREEHSVDRTVFYSYKLPRKTRLVFFIKAIYTGTFTWLPALVKGMYHPQYMGRTAVRKVKIN